MMSPSICFRVRRSACEKSGDCIAFDSALIAEENYQVEFEMKERKKERMEKKKNHRKEQYAPLQRNQSRKAEAGMTPSRGSGGLCVFTPVLDDTFTR
jgi:hypothetical protein